MSNAVSVTGILVKRAPLASPTSFVTVGEITKVKPVAFSRVKVPTTTHNDGTESNQLGILKQADGTLTINFLASDPMHQAILADIMGNVKNQWGIFFPSGVQQVGPARVGTFELLEANVDGIQQANLSLVWAGPVVQS